MAVPNEKLQEVLREIESKRSFSTQQLQIVRSQISSKTREKRMLQLSASELETLPSSTRVYEGVGKMFVLTSTGDIKDKQGKDATAVEKEMENLNKKLHYLETTQKNAEDALQRLLSGSGAVG